MSPLQVRVTGLSCLPGTLGQLVTLLPMESKIKMAAWGEEELIGTLESPSVPASGYSDKTIWK